MFRAIYAWNGTEEEEHKFSLKKITVGWFQWVGVNLICFCLYHSKVSESACD